MQPLQHASGEMKKNVLLVLTLRQHKDGVWIHKLVDKLQQCKRQDCQKRSLNVEVLVLEDWLEGGLSVSSPQNIFRSFCLMMRNDKDEDVSIVGLVNRVSDAAPPALFKACCAILSTASLCYDIPVVNGHQAYTMCANKWCHHVLFQKAQLDSPTTTAFWSENNQDNGVNDNEQEGALTQTQNNDSNEQVSPTTTQSEPNAVKSEDGTQRNDGWLLKPNAGGFGAGITKVDTFPKSSSSLPRQADGVTLVQDYVPPSNRTTYRIWFLQGKVQCGVERILSADTDNEFIGACASGGSFCTLASRRSRPAGAAPSTTTMKAWNVSDDVSVELESRLFPLLSAVDAHCGSVEFLYDDQGRRLYFDLNLLSTLPVDVPDPDHCWPDHDPWMEQAEAIWDIVLPSSTSS